MNDSTNSQTRNGEKCSKTLEKKTKKARSKQKDIHFYRYSKGVKSTSDCPEIIQEEINCKIKEEHCPTIIKQTKNEYAVKSF